MDAVRVKVRCTKHPEYTVLMLHGSISGVRNSSDSEEIQIDLSSCYCMASDPYNHEFKVEVV